MLTKIITTNSDMLTKIITTNSDMFTKIITHYLRHAYKDNYPLTQTCSQR